MNCMIVLSNPSRLVKLFTVSFSSFTWLMKGHLKCIFKSRTCNGEQICRKLIVKYRHFYGFYGFYGLHLKHQIPHGVLVTLWCAAVVLAGQSGDFRKCFINMSFILLCFSVSFEVFLQQERHF